MKTEAWSIVLPKHVAEHLRKVARDEGRKRGHIVLPNVYAAEIVIKHVALTTKVKL